MGNFKLTTVEEFEAATEKLLAVPCSKTDPTL